MLIVAIPKSASSSLLHTLGKTTRLPYEQKLYEVAPIPNECRILGKYHSDIRVLPKSSPIELASDHKFYKQHVFPCQENLALLRKIPKTVLLRDPKDIISAYWRAEQAHIHKSRDEFHQKQTEEEWLSAANTNGLLGDLEYFYSEWVNEANNHPATVHVLHYETLMIDPDREVKEILDFFKLRIPRKTITLSKKRYSRGSPIRNLMHRLQRLLD
jgi:hypothetical protein